MTVLLLICFLFLIGSMFGWVLEVFYRRFWARENVNKKWINPGFLTGPYLPLYGFGLCFLFFIATLGDLTPVDNRMLKIPILFVVMSLCMTLLELIAGEIFVIGMKVKLWDYSENKFNYKGIICPKYSFFWGILGIAYYIILHPRVMDAVLWLSKNLAFSFFVGMFFGVFAIDVIYSFNVVAKIRNAAIENGVIVRYEELKYQIKERTERSKNKFHFWLSFHTSVPLREHIMKYTEKYNERMKKLH